MVSNIKKVKLKYLIGLTDIGNDKDYKWDILRNSIKDNGYDSEKYKPIIVSKSYNDYYIIYDGHHRVFILKELYDGDYEVDVEVEPILRYLITLLFLPIIFLFIYIIKFISIFIKHHSGKLIK
jgi:hypothetical protein